MAAINNVVDEILGNTRLIDTRHYKVNVWRKKFRTYYLGADDRVSFGFGGQEEAVKIMFTNGGHIPKNLWNDTVVSGFIGHIYQGVKLRQQSMKANIRALQWYLSLNVKFHSGVDSWNHQTGFIKSHRVLRFIKDSKQYKETVEEQAVRFRRDDVMKIRQNTELFDEIGRLNRYNLQDRLLSCQFLETGLRGANVHGMNKVDCIIYDINALRECIEALYVVKFVCCGSNREKHKHKDTVYLITCDCVKHFRGNLACPVGAFECYFDLLRADENYMAVSTKQTPPEVLPLHRRVRYKDKLLKSTYSSYFSYQRLGRARINGLGQRLDEKLNLSCNQGVNEHSIKQKKKKKFSNHSFRLAKAQEVEENVGSNVAVPESIKKTMTGHDTTAMYNRYAGDKAIKESGARVRRQMMQQQNALKVYNANKEYEQHITTNSSIKSQQQKPQPPINYALNIGFVASQAAVPQTQVDLNQGQMGLRLGMEEEEEEAEQEQESSSQSSGRIPLNYLLPNMSQLSQKYGLIEESNDRSNF